MSRTSQFARILTCAFAFFLLCGLILSTPSKASAAQITESIDSTMTITMQQTSGGGSTDEDTSNNNSTTDSTSDKEKSSTESAATSTDASKKDGNLPVTGDVLLFAIIGMVVLCAGSVYCASESKKLKYAHGAHVRRSFQGGPVRTQEPNKIKKRVVVVAVTCALLATTCFGAFASKASAASEDVNADVTCTSAVKIDESGNVLSANVTVQNNSLKAIDVESVVAPTELKDWNATFETTSVAVSGSTTGTWDGKTVPADILQQVKENGSVNLSFQLTVSTDPDPLDFSQFSLEEKDWVYDSTQKTPEVVCTGSLVKDTDYTVTYGENVNAGEGTVTITGKGEYTGSKVFTFTISKAKLAVSGIKVNSKTYDATTDATFNYDAISVTGKVGSEDVSVTATGTFASANVGTKDVPLTLALAGIDVGNYEIDSKASQSSAQGEITAKEVTITWDPTDEAKYMYDGATHTPTATVGIDVSDESVSATLAYKDSSGASLASAPSEIGTYTATVVALSEATASNYALPATGLTKSFEIFSVYTIVYHGNGGVTSGDKDNYTQTCTPDAAGALDANAFTQSDKTFAFWTVGTESSGAITSDNAKTTNTYLDQYSFTSSFEGATKDSTVHLYAYWKDNNTGNYWMSDANAADPGANATKTQSDIDSNKSDVTFWTNLYNGGNDTSHLYTYWKGTEADPVKFANRFIEFRIIQVGEHDGDGSAVTFMATHSLPTAKQMNTGNTNAGGWTGSEMYRTVFGSGSNTQGYVATGLSGLKDAVKPVIKKSTAGRYNSWNDATSTDAFWLISFSELAGENTAPISSWNCFKNEGSQYDWCESNVKNPTSTNDAIADMDKIRDGSSGPAGCNRSSWWLRSPSVSVSHSFGVVDTDGDPSYICNTSHHLGVVPCFSF